MTEHAVDVLAVGPHPDDVELLCGGTLARCADQGYRTGILDLTRGETGTRGNAELRAAEAQIAAGILGVSVRLNAGLPDAAIENSRTARELIVDILRQLKPRVVILPGSHSTEPGANLFSSRA